MPIYENLVITKIGSILKIAYANQEPVYKNKSSVTLQYNNNEFSVSISAQDYSLNNIAGYLCLLAGIAASTEDSFDAGVTLLFAEAGAGGGTPYTDTDTLQIVCDRGNVVEQGINFLNNALGVTSRQTTLGSRPHTENIHNVFLPANSPNLTLATQVQKKFADETGNIIPCAIQHNFLNHTAAISGGLVEGQFYHTDGIVKIVFTPPNSAPPAL